jgi:hypothetical protein
MVLLEAEKEKKLAVGENLARPERSQAVETRRVQQVLSRGWLSPNGTHFVVKILKTFP